MTAGGNAFSRALDAARGRRRRRVILVASVVGGIALLAGLAIWVFWFSSLLVVQRIDVSGTALTTSEQVIDAAGVATGTPVAAVDLPAVTARVASLDPVASARVSRSFPDALAIEVTERQVVFVSRSGGLFSWVDLEGIEFHATAEPPEGVPVAVAAGQETRLLRDVATVVGALPVALSGQAIVVDSPSVDRIVLDLPDGRVVVWGSAEDSALKSEVLAALLSVEASVYDVSAPNHPTTK